MSVGLSIYTQLRRGRGEHRTESGVPTRGVKDSKKTVPAKLPAGNLVGRGRKALKTRCGHQERGPGRRIRERQGTSYGLDHQSLPGAVWTAGYRREGSPGLTCGQRRCFSEESLALASILPPFLHCLREGHSGALRGEAEMEAPWLQQPLPVLVTSSQSFGFLISRGLKPAHDCHFEDPDRTFWCGCPTQGTVQG